MGLKLFVDDLRQPPDDSWTVARTVTEAIRILDTQDVEEVALDHDITHAILPDDSPRPTLIWQGVCCPETFEPVARFIASAARFRCAPHVGISCETPIKASIHTSNPAGAQRMKEILAAGGIEAKIRLPNWDSSPQEAGEGG